LSNILKKIFVIFISILLLGNIFSIKIVKAADVSMTLSHEVTSDGKLKLSWTFSNSAQADINKVEYIEITIKNEFYNNTKTSRIKKGTPEFSNKSLIVPDNYFPDNAGYNKGNNYIVTLWAGYYYNDPQAGSLPNTYATVNDYYITNVVGESSKPNNFIITPQITDKKPTMIIDFDKATGRGTFYAIFRNGQKIYEFTTDAEHYHYVDKDVNFNNEYTYYISPRAALSTTDGSAAGPIKYKFGSADVVSDCLDLLNQYRDVVQTLEQKTTEINLGTLTPGGTTTDLITKLNSRLGTLESSYKNKNCDQGQVFQLWKTRADVASSNAKATDQGAQGGNTSDSCGCDKYTGFGAIFEAGACKALCWISQMIVGFTDFCIGVLISAAGIQ
jgi:hypothetical protein